MMLVTSISIIILSFFSTKIWSEKKEEITASHHMIFQPEMTLGEISTQNKIPPKVILKALALDSNQQMNQTLSSLDQPVEISKNKIIKSFALYEENSTKNWFKIPLKFFLWFSFMFIVFRELKNKTMTPLKRKIYYILGFIIFGIILGADPSPMGTVKDAIVLYGEKYVWFAPRMVALFLFLLTVFLANKMICSWGCQFGSVQDFLFRINRTKKDNKGLIKQYKIPFAITNGFRIVFFLVFTALAFLIPFDIVSQIDPFKMFKPQFLTIFGSIFLAIMLISSVFIYRPWCHLFCPFGLTGWLVEKFSWFKIKVDYDKCDGCLACEKACPSLAMEAILRQEKTIPDCFACGTCIEICPDDAISLTVGKRVKPPVNHFKK